MSMNTVHLCNNGYICAAELRNSEKNKEKDDLCAPESFTVFLIVFIYFCSHVCLVAGQCCHLNVNILEGHRGDDSICRQPVDVVMMMAMMLLLAQLMMMCRHRCHNVLGRLPQVSSWRGQRYGPPTASSRRRWRL